MMRTVTAHRHVRTSWRPSARDLRLIISVTLLGGAMGVAVRLVSILAATKSWLDPEHLPLGQAAFLGGAGLVSGCIVAALVAYCSMRSSAAHPRCSPASWQGAIFAVSAWIVDLAHHSPYSSVSLYVSPSLAAVLSVLIVWISQFGPPDTLAKLG